MLLGVVKDIITVILSYAIISHDRVLHFDAIWAYKMNVDYFGLVLRAILKKNAAVIWS